MYSMTGVSPDFSLKISKKTCKEVIFNDFQYNQTSRDLEDIQISLGRRVGRGDLMLTEANESDWSCAQSSLSYIIQTHENIKYMINKYVINEYNT